MEDYGSTWKILAFCLPDNNRVWETPNANSFNQSIISGQDRYMKQTTMISQTHKIDTFLLIANSVMLSDFELPGLKGTQ